MINRIVAWSFLFCLLTATFLASLGVREVGLDANFYYLWRDLSTKINTYHFNIPDIPKIPRFTNPTWLGLVINFLITVVNGLSSLINFVIMILNWIIDLIYFLVTCFSTFFAWIALVLKSNGLPVPSWLLG